MSAVCSCGERVTGRFCPGCGARNQAIGGASAAPAANGAWGRRPQPEARPPSEVGGGEGSEDYTLSTTANRNGLRAEPVEEGEGEEEEENEEEIGDGEEGGGAGDWEAGDSEAGDEEIAAELAATRRNQQQARKLLASWQHGQMADEHARLFPDMAAREQGEAAGLASTRRALGLQCSARAAAASDVVSRTDISPRSRGSVPGPATAAALHQAEGLLRMLEGGGGDGSHSPVSVPCSPAHYSPSSHGAPSERGSPYSAEGSTAARAEPISPPPGAPYHAEPISPPPPPPEPRPQPPAAPADPPRVRPTPPRSAPEYGHAQPAPAPRSAPAAAPSGPPPRAPCAPPRRHNAQPSSSELLAAAGAAPQPEVDPLLQSLGATTHSDAAAAMAAAMSDESEAGSPAAAEGQRARRVEQTIEAARVLDAESMAELRCGEEEARFVLQQLDALRAHYQQVLAAHAAGHSPPALPAYDHSGAISASAVDAEVGSGSSGEESAPGGPAPAGSEGAGKRKRRKGAPKRSAAGGGGAAVRAGGKRGKAPTASGGAAAVQAAEAEAVAPPPALGSCKEELVSSMKGEARTACVVGDRVWCGMRDNSIEVRGIAKGDKQHSLSTGGFVWSIAVVHDRVWVGLESGHIEVWTTGRKKEEPSKTTSLKRHIGGVFCIVAHRGLIYTGSNDFTILRWNPDGSFLKQFSGHEGGVRAILSLGPQLWSASDDRTIRVWSASTCACTAVLKGHSASVLSLVPTGDAIWSGSEDGSLRAWDIRSLSCCGSLSLGFRVAALSLMGPHQVWASGSSPKVHILASDAAQPSRLRELDAHKGYVNGLCRVRRVETRTLWSYSLSDGMTKVWRQEEVLLRNVEEELALALATARAMECDLADKRAAEEEAARLREQMRQEAERMKELMRQAGEAAQRQLALLLQRLAAAEQRAAAAEQLVERLRRELAAAQRQGADSRAAASQLRDRLRHAVDSLRRAERERDGACTLLQRERQENDEEASRRHRDWERAHEALRAWYEQQLAALRDAHARALAERDAAHRREMDSRDRELEEARRRADGASDELRRAREEADELRQRLRDEEARNRELRRLLADRDADLARAKKDVEAAKRRADEERERRERLERELDALRREFERYKDQMAEMERKDRDRAVEEERLRRERDDALERARRAEEEAEDLRDQLRQIRTKLKALEMENERLRDAYDELAKREQELRDIVEKWDVKRFDVIARELKRCEQTLTSHKQALQSFVQQGLKKVSDHTQRLIVKQPVVACMEALGEERQHVKDIITQCLMITEKLTIGSAVRGEVRKAIQCEVPTG